MNRRFDWGCGRLPSREGTDNEAFSVVVRGVFMSTAGRIEP